MKIKLFYVNLIKADKTHITRQSNGDKRLGVTDEEDLRLSCGLLPNINWVNSSNLSPRYSRLSLRKTKWQSPRQS